MTKQYADIARNFKVNPKRCDNTAHYEEYITQDCFADHMQGMGVTHIFVNKNHETSKTAIAEALSLSETVIGLRYVVLCADPAAVGFYSRLGFSKIPSYQEIPREHRNKNCVPMMLKLKY